MRFVSCSKCYNHKVPLNSSLQVDGLVYCETCLNEMFPTAEAFQGKQVVRDFDPTICSQCATDFGEVIIKRRGEYPICELCDEAIEERVFPAWVKGFFVGVLVLVVFSFIWNWRFIKAYYVLERAHTAIELESVEGAAARYGEISELVPEASDYYTLAQYYKGMALLQQDKTDEALEAFQKCKTLPQDFRVEELTIRARIGIAHDKRDYAGFVKEAEKFLSYDSSSTALAQVASAYSCLYCVTKTEFSKKKALTYLSRARMLEDSTTFFSQYENLIDYRLATGDDIDREKFIEKYPQGWTNPN